MRRALAGLLVAVLLMAGCQTVAGVEKGPYIERLIGSCAAVNVRIAQAAENVRAGVAAEQLRGLIDQIRGDPAPREDRETLERVVDRLDATADRFAASAEAAERGDQDVAAAEAAAAGRRFSEASDAATEYGMVPLDQCDEVMRAQSGQSASAAPSPEPSGEPEEPQGWREVADARLARQQVAVAEVDGTIYVAGGITEHAGTVKVEAFDPVVKQWSAVRDLPIPLHHAMAVNLGGRLVVLGGWRPRGNDLNREVSDQVFEFDGSAWIRLQPMRRARAAGAAAVVDDKIIVVGGQTGRGLVAETEIYDPETNEWSDGEPIPTPREHLAAASDGRYVYAAGGRDLTSDNNFDVLERYDPRADAWENLRSMPAPRGSIGADVVDGRLVVVGGETPTAVLDDAEAYDIVSDRWSGLPGLTSPRHGLGIVAVDSVVYALHGAERIGHVASSATIEAMDMPPRRREPSGWRSERPPSLARQQVAVAVVDGAIWVAGGLEDDAVATRAVERLDPVVDQWQRAPDLPQTLHHAMAVNYRDELVVLGGWVPLGSDPTAQASDRVYVLRGDEWEELGRLNRPRAAGAAAVVDDTIVVVGGQNGDGLIAETESYDPDADRWRDREVIPTPREHLAAGADDRYVYAVGGREMTKDNNLRVLERYDPRTDSWETLRPMPTARGSIGATVIEGRLVVVGGEAPTAVLDTVELYDIALDRWTTAPKLRTALHGAGVAALGPVVYVIGGAMGIGHTNSTATVEALDFE